MGYITENYLPTNVSIKDVSEFLELIKYMRIARPKSRDKNEIARYYFFEETDYKSWSGVSLSIYKKDENLTVFTHTPVGRSFFDLEHQNYTVRILKKFFGGTFITDEGKERYMQNIGKPPTPPQAGCHLAYHRFGINILKAYHYFDSRNFPNDQSEKTGILDIDEMNPRLLSNNLLIPFLISILEDYFKSTYVVLLKYSDKKEGVIKNSRIPPNGLIKIASNTATVEETIAESLSFQNITSICQNFKNLDSKLEIAGILRKPYRKRKISLFESLEEFVGRRHKFIHQAEMDVSFQDSDVKKSLDDFEEAVTRSYKYICDYYGWLFIKTWFRGRKHSRKPLEHL